jgi:hypothetical protein
VAKVIICFLISCVACSPIVFGQTTQLIAFKMYYQPEWEPTGTETPTPRTELLKQYTFVIKKGSRNSVDCKTIKTITTDSLGVCKIKLPLGKYHIVDERMSKPFNYYYSIKETTYDSTCMRQLWQVHHFNFEVSAHKKNKLNTFIIPYNLFYGCRPKDINRHLVE